MTEQPTEIEAGDIRVDFSIYYPILPTAINVMNILIEKGYMDEDTFIYEVRPGFPKLSWKKADLFYSWTYFFFFSSILRVMPCAYHSEW